MLFACRHEGRCAPGWRHVQTSDCWSAAGQSGMRTSNFWFAYKLCNDGACLCHCVSCLRVVSVVCLRLKGGLVNNSNKSNNSFFFIVGWNVICQDRDSGIRDQYCENCMSRPRLESQILQMLFSQIKDAWNWYRIVSSLCVSSQHK